jgi:hypothetical protein
MIYELQHIFGTVKLTVEWLEEAQQCAVSECDLLLADIHTVQVRFSSRKYR